MDNEQLYDFDELKDSFDFTDDIFGVDMLEVEFNSRIIVPPRSKDKIGVWKNAQRTASEIKIFPGMSYFGILDGSFIFGDLLEAILVGQDLFASRLDIQTLSLSQENVDSLATLLIKDYVGELNLIVSDYFYSHERQTLIPYIYEQLDIDDKFQLAVAGTHVKVITADIDNIKMVMHGSSNLRSSGNIEQVSIQDNKEIYNFMLSINDIILDKYKTINKSIRRNRLWQKLEVLQKNHQ